MMKRKIVILLSLLLLATGCTAKLSEKEETFSDKGIDYSIQLPDTWETNEESKTVYGEGAVFSASDTKSNSSMYISTQRLESVDLKDFASKTKEQLAKTYNYENVEDLYMNEFEVDGRAAYKYTAFTRFGEKEVWAHLYYIETENGFVQLVYYSADDGSYKKRAEIIDESAKSLKQIKVTQESWEETTDSSSNTVVDDDSLKVANDTCEFGIKGARVLETKDKKQLLIIRYSIRNLGEAIITPQVFNEWIQAKQGEAVLQKAELPDSEKTTEEGLLVQQQETEISKNMTVDTLAIYELNDTDTTVLLDFSDEQFPGQDDIGLPIHSPEK